MNLDLVFLLGRTTSGGACWGFCELSMILGSLSANGWDCVPVFLVVWHGMSSTGVCWSLIGSGCLCWDRHLWERSCWLILCGPRRSLVVQCPEVGSPTSEAQAWHPAGAPRPCQPHCQVHGVFLAFWEVWGLLPVFSRCSLGVVPHVDVFLRYLWGGRWSPHFTLPPSWRSSSSLFLLTTTFWGLFEQYSFLVLGAEVLQQINWLPFRLGCYYNVNVKNGTGSKDMVNECINL